MFPLVVRLAVHGDIVVELRRIEAKVWEASNGRTSSGPRMQATWKVCVWEQAAWSEWATPDGHAVATILRDLLKAFDHEADRRGGAH